MMENSAEQQTRHFFETLGFEVERIPSINNERRADYSIKDYKNTYIVEVKGKLENDEYQKNLNKGQLAYREEALGYTNRMSKLIREAAEQLNATPSEPEEYKIIVFVPEGYDPERQAIQFKSTLYGIVDLIDFYDKNTDYPKPCFYFTFNEFFKFRNLDAAIILKSRASRLFVNSFSRCINKLRKTILYKLHNKDNAICDPMKMEEDGEAFVAGCDLDRHDESAILDYVKKKYDLDFLLPLKPKNYRAAIQIRKKI
jgi:hypothetical protein